MLRQDLSRRSLGTNLIKNLFSKKGNNLMNKLWFPIFTLLLGSSIVFYSYPALKNVPFKDLIIYLIGYNITVKAGCDIVGALRDISSQDTEKA
jgi:hypothetical protein